MKAVLDIVLRALLTVLATCSFALPLQAQTLRTIHGGFINRHPTPVVALHVRIDRAQDWGPNLIPQNEPVTSQQRISLLAPTCGTFQLRATLSDGKQLHSAIPQRLCLARGAEADPPTWWFRLAESGKIEAWDRDRWLKDVARGENLRGQAKIRELGRNAAIRDGIKLRLRMIDGRYVELTDNCFWNFDSNKYDDVFCERKTLVGTVPPARGYIVGAPHGNHFYELTWISALTGRSKSLIGPPVPSPDRRSLVAKGVCNEGPIYYCHLEIWSIDARGEISRDWAKDMMTSGIVDGNQPLRWINPNTIEWKIDNCPATKTPPATPAVIRRKPNGWALEPATDSTGAACW